jgi:hypothetical protein
MKIKQEVIERINGRQDIKRALALALNIDRSSLWRWTQENRENGPLTTLMAVKIISERLGITTEEAVTECATETV